MENGRFNFRGKRRVEDRTKRAHQPINVDSLWLGTTLPKQACHRISDPEQDPRPGEGGTSGAGSKKVASPEEKSFFQKNRRDPK